MSSATGAVEQPAGTTDIGTRVESGPLARDDRLPAPSRGRAALGYALLAVLAYVPVLRSDPGKVAADTKQYMYLDPTRLLVRAAYMWDPHIGMGTVTHQNIGYLFPMGPYFWVFQKLGLPDWFAQRLWLGSILFFAGAGVLYLLRTFGLRGPGVVVAALAYMFTPYTLDYSARISALLLPFAALPWMIGLTRKALRDGGWRYPAIFALVVQLVGGVNATALIFAGVGPVLWLAYAALVDRTAGWRRVLGVTARIAVLTVLTSLWWIAGLEMQGTYGLDILKYTETVARVATASFPNEILRGLGYWFFYGGDRLGPWIESASQYTQRPAVLFAGYALVVLSLLAAGVLRWRHRFFFVVLLLVGMVIAVGPSPYADPTPLGSFFKAFATSSSAGLALRSTARAVPLVVLALAVMLGLGVNATFRTLCERGHRWLPAAVVGVVVLLVAVNLPSLFNGSWYGKNLERPENVPSYWTDATRALDRGPHTTRVLEEPGADFASYSWGNTVDPITPGMMDRPYLARELIPYGTPGTADLLNAFDRRFQEGVADPSGVVDVLRRMGIGAVVLRNDIQYQRYDLVRPQEINRVFAAIPGLGTPATYGPPSPLSQGKPPPAGARAEDEIDLDSPPNQPLLHPVVVYPVDDPVPIVHAASARRSIMLAGDGEGLIDASDAGLLAGGGIVRYSASYPTVSELRDQIAPDTTLVVTDQNRSRARIWSAVHETAGYTEQPGEKPLVADPNDNQLPEFPGQPADAMTTTQQRGISSIQATSYGNTITYTPEDRAVRRARRRREDRLAHVRAGQGGRAVRPSPARVAGHDRPRQSRAAGERRSQSLDHEGRRDIRRQGHADVRARRDVAQPGWPDALVPDASLLDAADPRRGGERSAQVPLRRSRRCGLRRDPPARPARRRRRARRRGRADARRSAGGGRFRFAVPSARRGHEPAGVAPGAAAQRPRALDRAHIRAPDRAHLRPHRERVREPRRERRARSTARWACRPRSAPTRASRCPVASNAAPSAAADGDPTTAWNTPFVGVTGQWVQYETPQPITFDRMRLQVVADGRHSVPTAIELQVDGSVREITLPAIRNRPSDNATVTVPLHFPALTGRRIRVTLTGIRTQLATRLSTDDTVAAPVGLAELGIPGLQVGRAPESLPGACRSDLLSIDGRPFPVRVTGDAAQASQFGGLAVAPCDPDHPGRVPTVELGAGSHDIRTSEGVRSGLQFDRLVLASAAGGGPLAVRDGRVTGLGTSPLPAPRVTVVHDGATRMRVHVAGADGPFWLVLGESQSNGWKATVVGGDSLGRVADGRRLRERLARPIVAARIRRRARVDAAAPRLGRDLDLAGRRAHVSGDRVRRLRPRPPARNG